jgi:phage gpG-like protein
MARRSAPAMAVDLDIFVDESEVQAALQALWWAVSGSSLRRFHVVATAPFMRERIRERFESEGDPTVGAWRELTESRQDIREHAGFSRDHPINNASGELERLLTTGEPDITFGAGWAAFWLPRNTRSPRLIGRLTTAQLGRPAGAHMPYGWGPGLGTKPSPSPTPPRPVLGMDMTDMAHLMAALEIFIAAEVGREIG